LSIGSKVIIIIYPNIVRNW